MINQLRSEVIKFLNVIPNCPSRWFAYENEDNLYEAYIFTLVAVALTSRGWVPTHKNIKGHINPAQFVFRCAPGKIWSTFRNYSYIQFDYQGKRYELHMGIEIQGISSVENEADISLVEFKEAEQARNKPTKHKVNSSKAPLVIECKCYTNPLGKNIGREFLGLVKDLRNPKNGLRLMATNLDDSGAVSKMIREHGLKFCDSLTPTVSTDRLASFTGFITEFCRNLA
jgi:hypothetical protein